MQQMGFQTAGNQAIRGIPRRGRPRTRNLLGSTLESYRRSQPATRSHRYRRSYQDSTEDSEISEESSETENTEDELPVCDDGPPINDIFCKVKGEDGYLVNWTTKSPVKGSVLKEEIKTNKYVKQYERNVQDSYQIVSNAGDEFYEAVNHRFFYDFLKVEKILAKRVVEISLLNDNKESYENNDYYIPGLPLDKFGLFRNMKTYDSPLLDNRINTNMIMRNDGIYLLSNNTDICRLKLKTQETKRNKVEYLVKWKYLQTSYATWESEDSLEGDIFKCVNFEQFQSMCNIFEKKRSNVNNINEITIPNEIPKLRRDIKLTETQKDIVLKLFSYKIQNQNCQIINGSGRLLSVITFLDILYSNNKCNNQTMIITEEDATLIWKEILNNFSCLKWVSYFGLASERQAIRENEFKNNDCDVILISPNIFFQDKKMFKNFIFDNVVVDCVYSGLKNEWKNVVDRIDKFTIFIGNGSPRNFITIVPSVLDEFSFTEKIILSPNLIEKIIQQWIINIFNPKNARTKLLKRDYILYKLYLLSNNPFRIPQFYDLFIKQYKALFKIEGESLDDQNLFNFYLAFNGKLKKLYELIQNNYKKTLVISDDLSDLRMISKVLTLKGISNGFAFSNNKNDKISLDLSEQIILSTRDVSIFKLDNLIPEQIIFFDISRSFKKEATFIQYITRNNNPEIIHLITDNSIEIDLFILTTTKSTFDFSLTKTPDPFFKTAFYYLSNPQQRTDVEITFPKNIPEITNLLNPALNKSALIEPWETAMGLYNQKQSVQQQNIQSSNFDWKVNDFSHLLSLFQKQGISDWDDISKKMGKPVNEVIENGKSILLCLILQVNLIQYMNVVNSIIWFVFNSEPYNNEINIMDYWKNLAKNDKNLTSPIFIDSQFSRAIHSVNIVTRTLDSIYKHWMIYSFLSIRKENYIPIRCMLYGQTPNNIYQILHYYLENGDNWKQATELNIPPFIKDKLELYFTELLTSVTQDIYSFVLHNMKTKEIDEQLTSNKYLKPLFNTFQNGPFISYWTSMEHQIIMESLLNFYVPITPENQQDWEEFHAITKMTTKSSDMICKYVTILIKKIKETNFGKSITLDTSILNPGSQKIPIPSIIISEQNLNFIKNRTSLQENIHQLSILKELIFKDQIELSKDWNAENDKSLIQGICQFGYNKISNFWTIDVQYYQKQFPCDIIMENNLSNTKLFLQNKESVEKRLNYLIATNLKSTRDDIIYGDDVKAIDFHSPSQSTNQKKNTKNKKSKKKENKKDETEQILENQKESKKKDDKSTKSNRVIMPIPTLYPSLKFSYQTVPKILFKL